MPHLSRPRPPTRGPFHHRSDTPSPWIDDDHEVPNAFDYRFDGVINPEGSCLSSAMASFCEADDPEGLRGLLSASTRVDPNQLGIYFELPLLSAAASGSIPCLSMLLGAGADARMVDPLGHCALGLLAYFGHSSAESAVGMLVAAGADIERPDPMGLTPLLRSCWAHNPNALLALVHHGAILSVRDPGGRDARAIASRSCGYDYETTLRYGSIARWPHESLRGEIIRLLVTLCERSQIADSLAAEPGLAVPHRMRL